MRLIDADNLKTVFTSGIRVYDGKCSVAAVIHNIDNAPTIEANEWISVKDKLPSKTGFYLTCDSKNNMHVFLHHVDLHAECPFGIFPNNSRLYMPTHWMPLPSPPKEVIKNE